MHKKENFKIIRVPIPTPTLWPNSTTNCYILGNENESILVDAGYDQKETRESLEKSISEHNLAIPKKIILSHYHPDHAPGVRQLIDWEPTVCCHIEEGKEILESIYPYDKITFLKDGEKLKAAHEEITILHTPGHTKGHLNLYLPSLEILLSGDNLVAEGTSWIGPPDGDMSDYLNTLNRLKGLKLAKIAPGHGDWILKPYEHIDFVIERRLLRENQIKSLLNKHKQLTSEQLTELIYEDSIPPSVFEYAKLTTEAHLTKLIKEGLVSLENSRYSILADQS